MNLPRLTHPMNRPQRRQTHMGKRQYLHPFRVCNRAALPLLAIALLLTSQGCNSPEKNSPPSTATTPTPTKAPAQSEALKPTPAEPPASQATTSSPDSAPPAKVETTAPQASAEPEPGTEAEPALEGAIASDPIAQRLTVAGIDNPQAVKDFIAQAKTAATNNDAEAIANLIHYPFTTYDMGEPVKTYTTPAELIADFDQVVTPAVITALSQANYDDLFANYQGAMIGDGTVWFGQFEEGLKIQAINS